MTGKEFRYLNKTHCSDRTYIAPGSDKPSELHNIFCAMVASTKKREPIMTEQPKPTIKATPKKNRGGYKGKTPEQHLDEAKALTLFGIKVLDEAPRKVGTYWQVLIECERFGNKKWINKGDLTRTKSCGCLYASRSEKKIIEPKIEPKKLAFGLDKPIVDLRHEPKTEPFEIVEIVENVVENEKEVMTTEEKMTLMDILEAKQSRQKSDDSVSLMDCIAQKSDLVGDNDRVCVSRYLVDRLARECGNKLRDFWLLPPAEFNAIMRDVREIYEALQ